jgi:hypothetical protein
MMPPLVSIFQSSTGDDGISSRRLITFLAFVCCAVAFFAKLFFGYKIEPNLFDGMMYIVIGGLGVTVAERFASKPKETK